MTEPDPELDDFFENFGKVGKPGEPHPLADGFEDEAVKERVAGRFEMANLFQDIANRLRSRAPDPFGHCRGLIPPSSPDE